MKKRKTFFTLLGMAGIITVITLTVSNTMSNNLEKELAQRTNRIVKKPTPTPTVSTSPSPVIRPTLPPSPTPMVTPAETPKPTPSVLQISLPVSGAEVLTDYTEDMLVFQATYGDYRTHCGIDFGADEGTPVYAAADGMVTKNEFDYECGYTVEITHSSGYLTRYSNLASDKVISAGQQILMGEQIGNVGNSGIWEAHLPCHLHFELEQNGELLNPRNYLYAAFDAE